MNSALRRWRSLPGAGLAAAVLILASSPAFLKFVVLHPDSFSANSLRTLAGHGLDLGFAFVWMIGLAGAGAGILRKFLPELGETETFLVGLILGETLASFLIFGLGAAGFFQRGIFAALFSVAGFFAALELRRMIRRRLSLKFEDLGGLSWAAWLVIFFALLRAAVAAGSPPTDWDSLAYHLAFPKIFLRAGAVQNLGWSFNIHYPLSQEMLYGVLLALRGELAVQWLNFLHGALALLCVGRLAERLLRGSGVLAAALFAAQPIFHRVNGSAGTDLAATFFILAAVDLALRSGEEGSPPILSFLTGLAAGAAASTKLIGLWAVAAFLAGFALRSIQEKSVRPLVRFTAGAVLFGSFWYLRNWVWTGNPFWPYWGRLFGAGPDELAIAKRSLESVTEGVPKTIPNWILSPLWLTWKPESFGQNPYFLPMIFCIFLFAAVTLRRRLIKREDRRLLIFMAIYGSIWFWVYQMWRYLLPASGIACALIAAWFLRWREETPSPKWAFLALAAIVAPLATVSVNNPLYAFFGLESKVHPGQNARERYLESALGSSYGAIRQANRVLPEDAKIVLFKEVRGYYLDRDYAWGDPLNPGAIDYARSRDAEEIFESLRRGGFTHILVNPWIGGYRGDAAYYNRAYRLVVELIRGHGELVAEVGGVRIYKLKNQKDA